MNTVKFIEIDIQASGFGCVNTNGNIDPRTGKDASAEGYKNKIFPKSRDGQLYISNNSIRAALFTKEARGIMLAGRVGFNNNSGKDGALEISKKDIPDVSQTIASSYLGLLRGYLLTVKGGESIKRKSPLMITDFVNKHESAPNKNEIMVNHLAIADDGSKDKNSLFYAETWGDTQYQSKAIISIENLQFISTDSRLGQREVDFGTDPKKDNVKKSIEAFKEKLINSIEMIAEKRNWNTQGIDADFGLFERKDVLFQYPEEGFLLNDAAISILVKETIERINELQIIKSKGFMKVDGLDVRYSFGLSKYLDEIDPDDVKYEQFYSKHESA